MTRYFDINIWLLQTILRFEVNFKNKIWNLLFKKWTKINCSCGAGTKIVSKNDLINKCVTCMRLKFSLKISKTNLARLNNLNRNVIKTVISFSIFELLSHLEVLKFSILENIILFIIFTNFLSGENWKWTQKL